MPRFFNENIKECPYITGDDAKHIAKVLRSHIGDIITVCDTKGSDYTCEIIAIEKNISLKVLNVTVNDSEPATKVRLYQALPKGDKFDFIIQKATELGIYEVIPMLSTRCVARLSAVDFSKKLTRYNRIALEAAKQCNRGIIPIVSELCMFEQAIERSHNGILFYEGYGKRVREITINNGDIDIFIGSEGGFDLKEIDFAISKGLSIATLGKRILRCETAPIVALSLIMDRIDIN